MALDIIPTAEYNDIQKGERQCCVLLKDVSVR